MLPSYHYHWPLTLLLQMLLVINLLLLLVFLCVCHLCYIQHPMTMNVTATLLHLLNLSLSVSCLPLPLKLARVHFRALRAVGHFGCVEDTFREPATATENHISLGVRSLSPSCESGPAKSRLASLNYANKHY